MRTPGGSRTSAIARGREGATAGASAENGRSLSVAFSCPDRLRQWDHFVVGAAAASEHREIVIGSAGMEPPSPLDCACCRSINEGRKRKSLSIAFDIEKNSGIDCGDSDDPTPLIAEVGRNVRCGS